VGSGREGARSGYGGEERSAEAEGSSGEVGKSSGEAAVWVGLRQQQGRLPRSR